MTAAAWIRWMLLFSLLDLGFAGYQFLLRPDDTARTRASDLYAMAERYTKAGQIDEAVLVYEAIGKECATAPIAPRAAWNLAEIQMRKRFQPAEARETLRNLIESYPESDLAPRAASSLAFMEAHADFEDEPLRRWLRASEAKRAGDPATAAEILSSIVREYPDAALRPLAAKKLAALR